MDDGTGEKVIRQAMNAVFVIRLYLQMNIRAVRKGLTYEAGVYEEPRAMPMLPE